MGRTVTEWVAGLEAHDPAPLSVTAVAWKPGQPLPAPSPPPGGARVVRLFAFGQEKARRGVRQVAPSASPARALRRAAAAARVRRRAAGVPARRRGAAAPPGLRPRARGRRLCATGTRRVTFLSRERACCAALNAEACWGGCKRRADVLSSMPMGIASSQPPQHPG